MSKKVINIYLTEEQKNTIQSKAKELGLSMNDFIRMKALQ